MNEDVRIFYDSLFNELNFVLQSFPELKKRWRKILTKNHLEYICVDGANEGTYEERLIGNAVQIACQNNHLEIQNDYQLMDIFNYFGNVQNNNYEVPRKLSVQLKEKSSTCELDINKEADLLSDMLDELDEIPFNKSNEQRILNVLETYLVNLPCPNKQFQDISLYDLMHLTCACAKVISKNWDALDYGELICRNIFLLVSFDISGIQDFIYTIVSKGAHKQLRSRSFYLDMVSEWMADSLLDKCGFNRANLIYSGGGHAYILLDNQPEIVRTVEKFEKEFNQFFINNFRERLFVAFGKCKFSPTILFNNTSDEYFDIFKEISSEISEHKLHRYDVDELEKLNNMTPLSEQECKFCHSMQEVSIRKGYEDDGPLCEQCSRLLNFSKNIQQDTRFVANSKNTDDGLPIGPGTYLHHCFQNDPSNGVIYVKNRIENDGIRIWSGDFAQNEQNLFSTYSEREWTDCGIKKLGALRCDVDDLGFAFMAGFSQQKNGQYNTFLRSSVFSRNMSMFFKSYVNQFAKGNQKEEEKHLTIIYAGGDDMFVIGAWDDVIAFGVDLRQKFIKWTGGKLHLSAGIGIFDSSLPINTIASQTGNLEDIAKANEGKDSICLFDSENVFQFDEFIDKVCRDKFYQIKGFFDNESERGKTFVYKLLDLIRNRDEKNRINFARLAYYLARLEEDTPKERREGFRKFKHNMRNWYDDEKEIRQVEMALVLYIYSIREE